MTIEKVLNNVDLESMDLELGLIDEEVATTLLKKMNVKSKKKRIRMKAIKRALENPTIIQSIIGDSPTSDIQAHGISLQKKPVTTLLKLGKQYFGDEDVVRNYYKKSDEVNYKNKDLLVSRLESRILNAEHRVRSEILQLIEA